MRAGEPLTDVRLLGAGAAARPGRRWRRRCASPSAATAALVRAGDVVDVLSAAPDGGAAAATVVTAVRVLRCRSPTTTRARARCSSLAATRSAAARLAAAAVTGRLSVVVHGR